MMDTTKWLRYLRFWGPNVRADVEDELAFHLEMRVRDLESRGWSSAAARAEAERIFGDVRVVQQQCVTIDERRLRRRERREVMRDMIQDLRFTARALRKSPGFSLMAIVCVALGVCATTTIFSAVNGILLRPLPYRDAEELVAVYARLPARNESGINIAYPDYLNWRDESRRFSQLGIWTWTTHTLSGGGEAERVAGAAVSANLFPLLGVSPLIGRHFTDDEERAGTPVMLIGHGLWQRRFGGDRTIVGRSITVDGTPLTIVGVMPTGFNFPDAGQAWVPFVVEPWMKARQNRGIAGAIGRLAPGTSIEAAQRDLDVISKRLQSMYVNENFGWDAEAVRLHDDLVGDLRRPLLIFLGAVGFVLLIACANVANLMLARGASRQREVAVRVALGAARARIVRHVLSESMLLALAGGALGTALSIFGVRLLRLAFPNEIPFYINLDVDGKVLAFSILLSAVTGMIFGIAPALRATRVDLNSTLREGGRGEAGARRGARLRSSLVIAEVSLAVMLLVGASLLLRSYQSLVATDMGFDEQGILSARVSLPEARYENVERRRGYWEEVYERVQAIPGVRVVGSAEGIPFSGWNLQAYFSIEGRPPRPRGQELDVHYQRVSPDYFRSIGVPLRRGRYLSRADRDTVARVALINEELARIEFGSEDPIGRRIRFAGSDATEPWFTIVGVVGTFRHYRLPNPMGPAIYLPQLASPSLTQTLTVRTQLPDPMTLAPAIRDVLARLDPNVPAYDVQSFEMVVSRSLWRQRLQGQVLGTFAGLALLLAAVGIYGVISYAVAQRTRELGVRMALGATRTQVMTLVVSQGAILAAAGVAIGVVGALALSRILASLLVGVSATDPTTFVGVPLVIALVAIVASLLPARRATRVDPVVAMRTE